MQCVHGRPAGRTDGTETYNDGQYFVSHVNMLTAARHDSLTLSHLHSFLPSPERSALSSADRAHGAHSCRGRNMSSCSRLGGLETCMLGRIVAYTGLTSSERALGSNSHSHRYMKWLKLLCLAQDFRSYIKPVLIHWLTALMSNGDYHARNLVFRQPRTDNPHRLRRLSLTGSVFHTRCHTSLKSLYTKRKLKYKYNRRTMTKNTKFVF